MVHVPLEVRPDSLAETATGIRAALDTLARMEAVMRQCIADVGPIESTGQARALFAMAVTADLVLADLDAVRGAIARAKNDGIDGIKLWMTANDLTTARGAGLVLSQAHRLDMRVQDEAAALAHLSDLGRLDEVMVTKADATKIARVARELEDVDIALEGTARVASIVWSLRATGGK